MGPRMVHGGPRDGSTDVKDWPSDGFTVGPWDGSKDGSTVGLGMGLQIQRTGQVMGLQ
jgi:hypothetical protein